MTIKLHNSLTKQIETFQPIKEGEVKFYSCGPTVYDRVHLGNFRTYVFEDTLRRLFDYSGYKVVHVMNITDIDDKTIARSAEDYGREDPNQSLKILTSVYEAFFLKDAEKLNIDFSKTQLARATEHIIEMQALIKKIPARYVAGDGVYFDINKYPDYGALVKLDQSHEHHRIRNDEYDKEHVADFALWKAKKNDEPSWDFEIDGKNIPGHPGWHIECSAMSTKYLGQPFDIHSGGIDLMFPHHENEIAQCKAANNLPMANSFIHSQHLVVDGRKMSKSLDNFYSLDDIEKKSIDPLAFRLLSLQAHYQSQLNFTWDALGDMQHVLSSINHWSDLRFQDFSSPELKQEYQKLTKSAGDALANNLNTSEALAVLNRMVSAVDELGPDKQAVAEASALVDKLFGLSTNTRTDIDDSQKALLVERAESRQQKNWQRSDQLRVKLESVGVEVRDTKFGQVWHKKTLSR